MARTGTGTGTLLSRRNVKLDSFLKRNMERAVYERIRVHEPCVVVSDTINKVYMHVVLSDERVFLTEYPPRTLTVAVSFGRVRDIELVNDLPDFLRGKDQERCQHIRIVYAVETPPPRRRRDRLTRERGEELPPVTPPPRSLTPKSTSEGHPPDSSLDQWTEEDPPPIPKPLRSASCPNPQTLSLLKVPRPPGPPFSSPPSPSRQSRAQGPRRISLILDRLLRRDRADPSEDKGAELHLYAVSHSSTIYLHLQSAWTRFLTRSTLLLDPLHRWRCSSGWDPPPPSNRSGWLLGRLSRELQRDGVSPEASCLLLRELRTAARRDVALRRLFWRVRTAGHGAAPPLLEVRGPVRLPGSQSGGRSSWCPESQRRTLVRSAPTEHSHRPDARRHVQRHRGGRIQDGPAVCQQLTVSSNFPRTLNIPDWIARPAGSPWIVVGSGRRCRAGLMARLKKQPFKPSVPSLFLSNAR
ncbi:uncharacterized protein C12orf56 homolog isoform X3 [Salarias fasciatus]|uniref:uncharacterized protein C12orf56 homolog isoform X3 n=1 Tax=Salarias fasciatus TaxID=181472 RepID=UPI001176F665|nr:uncharacterized protein C12orf56 homolog isoform X3 [Salarias fasciatus]